MAYNRRNLLTRIIRIQEITLEHTARGVSQKWVFENIIEPTYHICEKTYYNYLSTNAKRELSDIDNKVPAPSNQLRMFN